MGNAEIDGLINQLRLDRRRALKTSGAFAGAAALFRGQLTGATAEEEPMEEETTMAYQIEGRLLEVCTCDALCPCWVGHDPDRGTCDSAFAWHIDRGTIEGIDVSRRTFAMSVHIPGNALNGNWKAVVYIDDQSTPEQQEAMLKVFTGQLGGAIADLAGLIGEVIAVERAPITFTVVEGEGTLKIGSTIEAQLAPFQGATGKPTALYDTIFSTIPGSPAFVGLASRFRRGGETHGLASLDLTGHNSIQGLFRFEA